jgi:hypothetical protein
MLDKPKSELPATPRSPPVEISNSLGSMKEAEPANFINLFLSRPKEGAGQPKNVLTRTMSLNAVDNKKSPWLRKETLTKDEGNQTSSSDGPKRLRDTLAEHHSNDSTRINKKGSDTMIVEEQELHSHADKSDDIQSPRAFDALSINPLDTAGTQNPHLIATVEQATPENTKPSAQHISISSTAIKEAEHVEHFANSTTDPSNTAEISDTANTANLDWNFLDMDYDTFLKRNTMRTSQSRDSQAMSIRSFKSVRSFRSFKTFWSFKTFKSSSTYYSALSGTGSRVTMAQYRLQEYVSFIIIFTIRASVLCLTDTVVQGRRIC